jgi:hypothetical protein
MDADAMEAENTELKQSIRGGATGTSPDATGVSQPGVTEVPDQGIGGDEVTF